MIIKSIELADYRNYDCLSLQFDKGTNILYGDNAQGKTNILDAIYHLSMCKSYFNLPDLQNIRHDEPFFVVQGKYERAGEEINVYCGVKRGQKKDFQEESESL